MIVLTPYHLQKNNLKFHARQKYLVQTINSIDNQTLTNLTHIVIDDGSDDDFCKKLQSESKKKNRIWLYRSKDKNELLTCTNALNFGIEYVFNNYEQAELGKHKHITFLHSDDLAINLEARETIMDKEDLDFLYTDALIFFNDRKYGYRWSGLPPQTNSLEKRIWTDGKMPYPTMTWRIDFLKNILEMNKANYSLNSVLDPRVGCGEDVDLALSSLECAKKLDKRVTYLPEITTAYRIHNQSLASVRNQKERKKEENSVLIKHFGYPEMYLLHIKRFLKRPGIYIGFFMKLQNARKEKIPVAKFIPSITYD